MRDKACVDRLSYFQSPVRLASARAWICFSFGGRGCTSDSNWKKKWWLCTSSLTPSKADIDDKDNGESSLKKLICNRGAVLVTPAKSQYQWHSFISRQVNIAKPLSKVVESQNHKHANKHKKRLQTLKGFFQWGFCCFPAKTTQKCYLTWPLLMPKHSLKCMRKISIHFFFRKSHP